MTLTSSSTYRRRHILPGIHLLQFLNRGKHKSVIKGRILSNYAAFGPVTPSAGPSGMIGDSMSLITGRMSTNSVVKEAYDLYSDTFRGITGSWRMIKAPLLNMLSKT